MCRPVVLVLTRCPCAFLHSFVAEMLANRIVRFVQRPSGVYHMSVFYQFSGRMGPSALAIDADDNLYVGRFDFAGAWKCADS